MGLLEGLHILDPRIHSQIHHSSSSNSPQSSLPLFFLLFVSYVAGCLISTVSFWSFIFAKNHHPSPISANFNQSPGTPKSLAMATSRDSIDDMHRDVLHDISYFEKYDLPATPPETPPMKQDARMTLRERNSIHYSLEKGLTSSPSQSPRMGFKRTFSSQSAFGLPMTPPATPPMSSRMDIRPSVARTLSDSVNKSLGHQISYVSKTRTFSGEYN